MNSIIKNKIVTDEYDVTHYYDNNGDELHDGDYVSIGGGRPTKLYLTDQGFLGTDATNPAWIESGRAFPCEYGIYVLERGDMEDIELVPEKE